LNGQRVTQTRQARADYFLTAAIALVALLVLALLLVITSGRESYEQARVARIEMRDLRIALINFARAQHGAREAARAYVNEDNEGSLTASTPPAPPRAQARPTLSASARLKNATLLRPDASLRPLRLCSRT